MYNYVYITENLINGKKYIGEHSTIKKNDKYLGSGKRIKKAIKKYGRSNFKKTILEYFTSKELAFNSQEKYIKKFNTVHPNGYNISPIGGYFSITDEMRNKLSKAGKKRKLTKEHRENISKANKSQIPWNKGKKGLQTHSPETKKRMSEKHRGKKMSTESKDKNRLAALKRWSKIKNKLR